MFWRKKKKVKYRPIGRIGHFTKATSYYNYTIIFEEIYKIGNRSKVIILEVDVKRDTSRRPHTREECLTNSAIGDWILNLNVIWETDEQYQARLNTPIEFTNVIQPVNNDVNYTQHTNYPFRHNFIPE